MINVLTPAKKKALWKRLMCGFFKNVLPTKTKRLIFIATLIAIIKKIDQPSDKEVQSINKIFNISSVPQAIVLPMIFAKKLWSDDIIEHVYFPFSRRIKSLTELGTYRPETDETTLIANEIITASPQWLLYSNRKEMVDDFQAMMKNLPNIETA